MIHSRNVLLLHLEITHDFTRTSLMVRLIPTKQCCEYRKEREYCKRIECESTFLQRMQKKKIVERVKEKSTIRTTSKKRIEGEERRNDYICCIDVMHTLTHCTYITRGSSCYTRVLHSLFKNNSGLLCVVIWRVSGNFAWISCFGCCCIIIVHMLEA